MFDLSSYSFHPKIEHREETGGVNIQAMPCTTKRNQFSLPWQDKMVIVAMRGSITSGATSRSFSGKVLINPSTLVNHWIGSSARESRQGINTYKEFGIQIYMYARWGQYTTLIQVQLEYSQVRECCYYRRASDLTWTSDSIVTMTTGRHSPFTCTRLLLHNL